MANQYSVRGLEPQNLSGHAYRIGSGGYWECNNALNQLAQLVSRVTINQWAMEQGMEQWRNMMQDNMHNVTQNQVILNQKIQELTAQTEAIAKDIDQLIQVMSSLSQSVAQLTVVIAKQIQSNKERPQSE